jgi:hypothetical protein
LPIRSSARVRAISPSSPTGLLSYALLSFKTLALVAAIVLLRNRPDVPYWEIVSSKSPWPTPRHVALFWLLFAFSVWVLFRISTANHG